MEFVFCKDAVNHRGNYIEVISNFQVILNNNV